MGNVIWTALSGVIVQNFGYIVLYWAITILNVLSLLFYYLALASAKKQGIE